MLCESLCSDLAGFIFQYIGTQEITRPGSRVEIVSAMRRIRVSASFITFISRMY